MFTKLFHKDVFVPEGAQEVCEKYQKAFKGYCFSRHFQEHLDNQDCEDRSHTYLRDAIDKCLKSIKDGPQRAFEIELGKGYREFGESGWFLTKYCIRIPYDSTQDLVVAIRPKYRGAAVVDNVVVTAWINSKNDSHITLDKSKYCDLEEWNIANY